MIQCRKEGQEPIIATRDSRLLLHRLDAAQFPARVVNYADSRSRHGDDAHGLLHRPFLYTFPAPFLSPPLSRVPTLLPFPLSRTHFQHFQPLSPSLTFPTMPREYEDRGIPEITALTRYYLQRTYVTFRTAYYCDYRRIMRRPSVLQFIIELL